MAGSPTPLLPGYRDLVPLGRGGYSDVYRAYQEQFDRWVAVKVLTFALTDDRSQRRFLRECRVAGRLSTHPNIVTVYDAGLGPDGRPYITMELLDGGSIGDRLRTGGSFEVADALRIAVSLAGALETAHRAGVVHRDVKPANVLLTAYGRPALADFGLSILAERQEISAGVDALTPYHAPPEVLERTTVTPRSDIYSLGSTAYAMLAGVAPHQRTGTPEPMAALLLRILQSDVPAIPRVDVPRSLDQALRGALARDTEVRTPSALAFAQALQQVQAELGLEVTQPVVLDVPGGAETVVVPPPAGMTEPSPSSRTVPDDAPWPAGVVAPPVPPGLAAGFASTGAPGESTMERFPLGPVPGPVAAAGPGPMVPPAPDPGPAPVMGAPAPEMGPAPVMGAPAPEMGTPTPGNGSAGPEAPSWPPAPGPAPGPAPPVGMAPDPAGWSGAVIDAGQPFVDGEATVHRSVVREPRPAPLTAPTTPRRWPWVVAVAVTVLATAGAAGAMWWTGRDDEQSGGGSTTTTAQATTTAGGQATTTVGEPADIDVPTGLAATESEAGVALRWEGDPARDYWVLVLSETQGPDVRTAEGAAELLLPPEELRPNEGYCFSVAIEEEISRVPADNAEQAFSPLQCIRGASPETVRTS